ncbi:hypothetical protein GF325_01920 [Candidatus Bathyarchaeota archaeon]|nr:hypothetical protein [Candidatus Bathyarchaeota archaeon]
MPYGLIILSYRIDLEADEIEPEFRVEAKENMDEDTDVEKMFSLDDRFRVYYAHTAGETGTGEGTGAGYYSGRLRDSRCSIASYYTGLSKDSNKPEYLICALIQPDESFDIFKDIMDEYKNEAIRLLDKLGDNDEKLVGTKLWKEVHDKLDSTLKYVLFQMSRLVNLNNEQKIAMIFNSLERIAILRKLAQGPISKEKLREFMEQTALTLYPNMELLLKPFVACDLIRRDWSKGVKDPKTGRIKGKGEFIYLVKDISLIRVPPEEMLKKVKEKKPPFDDKGFTKKYLMKVQEFFYAYNPLDDLDYKDSGDLAKVLLDPDTYDFLVLLRFRAYPKKKIPKVGYGETNIILKKLMDLDIVTLIEDKKGEPWVVLLSDPHAFMLFPEYLLENIRQRLDPNAVDPILQQVALQHLNYLESTYYEKKEF